MTQLKEHMFMPSVIDLPIEGVVLIMCRDVWHCSPNELRTHAWDEVIEQFELHQGFKQMEYELKKAHQEGH